MRAQITHGRVLAVPSDQHHKSVDPICDLFVWNQRKLFDISRAWGVERLLKQQSRRSCSEPTALPSSPIRTVFLDGTLCVKRPIFSRSYVVYVAVAAGSGNFPSRKEPDDDSECDQTHEAAITE